MPRDEAILLLHGFTNTHRCWQRLLDAGVTAEREVIAPDIRGHGASSATRPVDLVSVLDDLAGLVPERCTLVGYSQGGRIALHAALDGRIAPRLDRLVLISASPGIADPRARAQRRAADAVLANWIQSATITAFAQRWAQTPVLSGLAPELAEEANADRLQNTPAGLAAALRGLGTGTLASTWNRLGELSMPVTLIAGERDAKFSALAAEMATAIPRATVAIIPGVGHQVHLEAPGAVADVLLRR